jgi:hypothetical protein
MIYKIVVILIKINFNLMKKKIQHTNLQFRDPISQAKTKNNKTRAQNKTHWSKIVFLRSWKMNKNCSKLIVHKNFV